MNTEQAEILVANTSAVFSEGGQRYRIIKGRTTARRGAKIVKNREHMFSPMVIDYDIDEEPKPKPANGRRKKKEDAEAEAPEEAGTP